MSLRIVRPALFPFLLLACSVVGPSASGFLVFEPEQEEGEPLYTLDDVIIVFVDPDAPLDAAELDSIRDDPSNGYGCSSNTGVDADVTFSVRCQTWDVAAEGREVRVVGLTTDGRWYGDTLGYLEESNYCAGGANYDVTGMELVIDRLVVR